MRKSKVLILIFIGFLFASCNLFDAFQPGSGTIRVKLPGANQGRAIRTTPYTQDDAFYYDVIVEGVGFLRIEKAVPGNEVLVPEIPVGDYSVTVNAYKDEERKVKVATETTKVTVIGNETVNAKIIMKPLSSLDPIAAFQIANFTFTDGVLCPGATLTEIYTDGNYEIASFDLYKEYFSIDTSVLYQENDGENLLKIGEVAVPVTYLPDGRQPYGVNAKSKFTFNEPEFVLDKEYSNGRMYYNYRMTKNRVVNNNDPKDFFEFSWRYYDDKGDLLEDYDGFDLEMDGKSFTAVGSPVFIGGDEDLDFFEGDISDKTYTFTGTVEFPVLNVSNFSELKTALSSDGTSNKICITSDIEMEEGITVPLGKSFKLFASEDKVTLTPKNGSSYPMFSLKGSEALIENIDFNNNLVSAMDLIVKIETGSNINFVNCDFLNYKTPYTSQNCAIDVTGSDLSLKECSFTGNDDGPWTAPGVTVSSSNVNIEGCSFYKINTIGIYVKSFNSDVDGNTIEVKKSTFDSCGTAVKVLGSNNNVKKEIKLEDCVIKNCFGSSESINALSFAGSSLSDITPLRVTLDGCEIYENWGDVETGDGAVRVSGNVILNLIGTEKPTIIKNNFYPVAGALYVLESTVNIDNAQIFGNGNKNEKIADGYTNAHSTGGIFINSGSVQIQYPSEVKNNTCYVESEENGLNAVLKGIAGLSYLNDSEETIFFEVTDSTESFVPVNVSIPE